jgi:hypothetical protein
MTDEELMKLLERPRPKTPAEYAFRDAAIAVYREGRAKGLSPEDAWVRCTDLLDDALVGPVMKAEARAAVLP